MKIAFSPVELPEDFLLDVEDDAIWINGEEFDFAPLNEGDLLPRSAIDSPWFDGNVTRTDGEICLTIILPHGPYAPVERRYPEPIHVTENGPVTLPPYNIPPTEAASEDQLRPGTDEDGAGAGTAAPGQPEGSAGVGEPAPKDGLDGGA